MRGHEFSVLEPAQGMIDSFRVKCVLRKISSTYVRLPATGRPRRPATVAPIQDTQYFYYYEHTTLDCEIYAVGIPESSFLEKIGFQIKFAAEENLHDLA